MRIKEKIKYAFSIEPENKDLTGEEKVIIDKLAGEIVKRRLSAIAITFLESVKPLNFISSQALLFLQPIIQTIFPTDIYSKAQKILEKRISIEYLLQSIENVENRQKISASPNK